MDAFYGGVFLTPDASPVGVFAFFWPQTVFAYIFSDFFLGELREQMPYVFCRTKNRMGWFVKKTAILAGCVTVFCLAQFLILTLNCLLTRIPVVGLTERHIFMLFLNGLYVLTLSLSVGLLALKIDPVKGSVGLLGLHLGTGLAFLYGGLGKIAAFLPACRSVYFWHNVPGAIHYVPGLTIEGSFAMVCILILGLLTVGGVYVQKMDII